jgi:hypothetical protein
MTRTCPIHPTVTLRCPACQGSKGGQSTSPRKRRAARQNVARGLAVLAEQRAKKGASNG